jgi:hypothetical protein
MSNPIVSLGNASRSHLVSRRTDRRLAFPTSRSKRGSCGAPLATSLAIWPSERGNHAHRHP